MRSLQRSKGVTRVQPCGKRWREEKREVPAQQRRAGRSPWRSHLSSRIAATHRSDRRSLEPQMSRRYRSSRPSFLSSTPRRAIGSGQSRARLPAPFLLSGSRDTQSNSVRNHLLLCLCTLASGSMLLGRRSRRASGGLSRLPMPPSLHVGYMEPSCSCHARGRSGTRRCGAR